MSCSPFDLRDYFLKELPEAEGRQVEAHVKTCSGCREELERLQTTGAALLALRDEEIPQRIAFVSDKIFEPSPVRRWWEGFWNSTARLGFASAAILAVALVVRPVTRTPAPVPAPQPAVQTVSDAEIQYRIDAAVSKAVAAVEARQDAKTRKVLADFEATRQRLILAATENEISLKRANVLRAADYRMPPAPGDLK